ADAALRRSTPPDWLLRTDKFVPIGRFSELLIPKVSVLLAAVALVWAWRRRRDLLALVLMAVAGLALANHQMVTGLQIENFHWCYVWGPCLSLLLMLSLAGVPGAVGTQRAARALAWAVGGLIVASAFVLRAVEV